MTVIARDTVAADHLVYAWPLPIGVECEVACGDDDRVVMCPAWLVGDQLGPGRHHWRTPDPSRPTSAYFVRSTPVDVAFDMATTFMLPPAMPGGAPLRCRLLASGAVQVRCADPALLVAQFVGLPFDGVNDGILRSVSRSVERMLARLLTRRVVITGSAASVTDPAMLPHLIEELVAYNPAAGAVFGIELIRVIRLAVDADDGVAPNRAIHQTAEWGKVGRNGSEQITAAMPIHRDSSDLDVTLRGHRAVKSTDVPATVSTTVPAIAGATSIGTAETLDEEPAEPPPRASMSQTMRHAAVPAPGRTPPSGVPVDNATPPLGQRFITASGEIVLRPSAEILAPPPTPAAPLPVPEPPRASGVAPPETASKPTLSGIPPIPIPPPRKPTPPQPMPVKPAESKPAEPKPAEAKPAEANADAKPPATKPSSPDDEATPPIRPTPRHVTPIGHVAPSEPVMRASGEIVPSISPGARVRVPGADGTLRSATVRQLLQGYYELDVGAGETIWVPMSRVVVE